jgi:hypothetical protein
MGSKMESAAANRVVSIQMRFFVVSPHNTLEEQERTGKERQTARRDSSI